MFRSLAFGKIAAVMAILALPVVTTGCGTTGWGWSAPSMASLNPWRSSAAKDSSLASHKPSGQVPTPPAQMLAGNGLARGGVSAENGAPTYSANTYGGTRPTGGYGASTGDYGTRQVSNTQSEGYRTGPYNTGSNSGGNSTAQSGPYGGSGAQSYGNGSAPSYGNAPNYGGAAAATADRRADPGYGHGSGAQGYNNQNNQPANNSYQSAPSNQSYPNTGAGAYQGAGAASSYVGSTGLSAGASKTNNSTPMASTGSYGSDAYRPGSTARGSSDIQRASYDNQGTAAAAGEGNYPMTSTADDAGYQ